MRHTLVFTFASIAFQYVAGLALAVFFNRHFRLAGTLRALFLIPWLLPLIVSASTWSWMFNSESGVIDYALHLVGVSPVDWLNSPDWALTSVVIANIWIGIPFNLVILYSGLQNIPGELYEAASWTGPAPGSSSAASPSRCCVRCRRSPCSSDSSTRSRCST